MTKRTNPRELDPGTVADGDYVLTVAGGVITGLFPASPGGGTGVVETIVPGPGIAVDDADPANPVVSATGGGGGGSGSVLGVASLGGATTAKYSTTSTTVTDVDATNLAVTFTAPASGAVLVTLNAHTGQNSTAICDAFWGVREGTTTLQQKCAYSTYNTGQNYGARSVLLHIKGLTPGSTHTFKWAWRLSTSAGGPSDLFYGGPDGGTAVMKVEAA